MRDCAAFPGSWIKAIRRRRAALWLGARGAPDERRADAQLCAATQKVSGAELIGIFSHQKKKKTKPLFNTVEIPMGSASLFRNFLQKYLGSCQN